jgi:hypothetical protein
MVGEGQREFAREGRPRPARQHEYVVMAMFEIGLHSAQPWHYLVLPTSILRDATRHIVTGDHLSITTETIALLGQTLRNIPAGCGNSAPAA